MKIENKHIVIAIVIAVILMLGGCMVSKYNFALDTLYYISVIGLVVGLYLYLAYKVLEVY